MDKNKVFGEKTYFGGLGVCALVFAVGRQKSTFRLFGRSSKNDRLFDFSTIELNTLNI